MFQHGSVPAIDALVEVASLFKADGRADKIDLGIGVYRDEEGRTTVMAAVKQAEARRLESQLGKAYVGPGGDPLFCEQLLETLLPRLGLAAEGRLAAIQTPGGTGAYRLALDLVSQLSPASRIIVGTPTWPIHIPIADRVGMEVVPYPHYDPVSGAVDFDRLIAAADAARPNDVFLVHGCCHNPTGASLGASQWRKLCRVLAARGVVPLVDLAYAGLGDGIEADAAGARLLIEGLPQSMVAISCSKNFGLYSDRTGMLLIAAANRAGADACRLAGQALARTTWSNPPDHGAAVVRTILDDSTLRREWRSELDHMRARLRYVRRRLGASSLPTAPVIEAQEGLFAVLPFSRDQMSMLRDHHGIYADPDGRINIAGLHDGNIDRFVAACQSVSMQPCNA